MKAIILGGASVVLLAMSSVALAADGGAFIGGNVGRAHNTLNPLTRKTDTSWGMTTGYRWTVAKDVAIGPELGYMHLGQSKFSSHEGDFHDVLKVKVKGPMLGVNATFNLGSSGLYVMAHTGLFNSRTSFSFRQSEAGTTLEKGRSRSTKSNWYAGVGLGYDFSPSLGIGLNYNHFRAETVRGDTGHFALNVVSLSAEYRL
jgi:OOP family OmpA-OmpF porin/outer membrane immunogenic protein